MTGPSDGPDGFEPLSGYREYSPAEMEVRAAGFAADLARRRTTRHFSNRPVARAVIEHCLRAAGSAPSGAHQQPWHFVVVSDPALKRRVREAAEAAEAEFYATAPADWLEALAPLGTDAVKPYLETAPYLIAVFAERYGTATDGSRRTHYYVNESVGIATGFLLVALHHAGLATLTHTPSPMGFLSEVLERPANEKPVMLIVTGYPAADARVPRLVRKALDEIATFREGTSNDRADLPPSDERSPQNDERST
jgi:iodotyrosine deiodinase